MAAEEADKSRSDSDPEEEQAPASKRPWWMVLDDDEACMASALASLPTSTAYEESKDISETEEHKNVGHSSGVYFTLPHRLQVDSRWTL